MMKLRYSPTSPYARKVRITILELGLSDRVEQVETDPWTDGALRAENPLGKVPSLALADGETLYDSPVICEYLDFLAKGRLFPAPGPARWKALRQQALGDGLADAIVRRFVEQRRPAEQQATAVIKRQEEAIVAALAAAEREAAGLSLKELTIGEIALAAALGYLELRMPQNDWRSAHPRLARWLALFAERPSYAATRSPG